MSCVVWLQLLLGSSGRVAGRGVCCLCTLWSTCVGVTLHGEAGEAGGVV